ncbi:DNA-binding protein [Corynebacterium sp. DSM 45110]|uniref:DNA-binding protein n=2 Tax=Corynebacterium suicordis TaxID=203264 RepID=A0ABR9ZH34_9CORY|nr:DNA-binding protein [Corynebacterium suicordis DSM 45110]
MVCEIAPGFTPASLAQLRYSGKGAKFVKLGKRVFYRREDIEEWINSNIQTMTGAA